MKDKTSLFTSIGTFNTYKIYIPEVLTRINKHVPIVEMCTFFSMNRQYIVGDKTVKSLTSLPFGESHVGNIHVFQCQGETKSVPRTEIKGAF